MTITIPYILSRVEAMNTLCFQGQLPPIPVCLTQSKTFLAKVQYRRQRGLFHWENTDFCLRVNRRLSLSSDEIDDIIIHELIHYHIAYHHLSDTSSHGTLFRRMMNDINRTYGRHITVSQRLSSDQRAQLAGTRVKTHLVAVIDLADGRTCVKMIPHSRNVYERMQAQLPALFPVTSMHWYWTTDPYFNQFPTSTAFRMSIVTKSDILPHLQDARPVTCNL